MSTSSDVSLGSLRQQAKEAADLEQNPAITDPAWNSFITNSRKELYDMLISAYGNDYYVATTYQFSTTGSQSYPLPDGSPNFLDTTSSTAAKFYKLLGVDLQYNASPSGWITLRNFQMIERNRFAMPNTQTSWVGYTNLRYRVQGNNLYLAPVPQTGQKVQLWYAPAPTNLQYRLQGATTVNSGLITFADTTGLASGMNVQGEGIPTGVTIASLGSTSIIVSGSCTATQSSVLVSMWSDSTLVDGVSGWEEYVIVDAAIKAQQKQENDDNPLFRRKMELKTRIESMAEGRDIGQAHHTSDVMGANGVWGGDYDGGGWGMGGGW
jgi:hypothetical protein